MPFTVEFDDNGTITRVFGAGVTKGSEPSPEIHPHSESTPRTSPPGVIPPGLIAKLAGKSVSNITSVTILTTEDHDPCISQYGKDYCW